MDIEAVREALDNERKNLCLAGQSQEVFPDLTRRWSNAGSWHEISFSSVNANRIDEAIFEQIAHFRSLNVPFEWKVYSYDRPEDLCRRLETHGFSIGPSESVMVREVGNGKWINSIVPQQRHQVLRVERADQISEYRRIAEAVFEKDYEFTSNELMRGIQSGSRDQTGYLAFFEGEPVAIGRLYTSPRSCFGGLYGGGTLPAFRGLGLYRALVAARARDAVKTAKYLLVDALPTSRPILERLGFVEIAQTWPCEWTPKCG